MLLAFHPSPPAFCQSANRTTVHEDLTFAETEHGPLQLDLHLPPGESRTLIAAQPPLVVWIHGGGWRGGSRKNPPIRSLCSQGFAVASISYRFTDKEIFPAQIHDCKAAIRWLRAKQSEYGYDANRIGVAGSSAGGHLALLIGTSGDELGGSLGEHLDQSAKVQAIVDFFGPSDFELRGRTQPDRAYTEKSGSFALLGGVRHGTIPAGMERTGSPTTYITEDDPPLLIFHGDADKTVLLDQSERMRDAYIEAGLNVHLEVIADAGHGGKVFYSKEQLDKISRFFRETLVP